MDNKAPVKLMELKKDFKEEEEDLLRAVQKERHLQSDAIYEILTRVSLYTLLHRCRWVCKDWQKLICDTNFQLIHSQRTPIASGYFIQSLDFEGSFISFFPIVHQYSPQIPSPSLDFLPTKDIKIRGTSAYGSLLCCVSKPPNIEILRYYICKPATREWRQIPNPRTRFTDERMVVVVKQSFPTLHYKILRITDRKCDSNGYHCEMFDSIEWVWKRMKDIKLPNDAFLGAGCNILVNGGLHWLTSDRRIFVFYIDQENWTTIKLPHEIEDYFIGERTIIHTDGKIGVIYSTKTWMELWILDGSCSAEHAWKKKCHNDLRSLYEHTGGYSSPVDMCSPDIITMMNARELVWYNCKNDTYTTSTFLRDSCQDVFFPFRSEFIYL